jgi:integrase/recombinase XerD
MSGKKGFAAVASLRERARTARGGSQALALPDTGAAVDALGACAARWLEALAVRRMAARTLEERRFCLRVFLVWAVERDLRRAGEITRPILEAYQRALFQHRRKDGRPLSWSAQRERLRCLMAWFRWLTRQDVLLHNPASELELPRPERRLPVAGLTTEEVARLCAVPAVADPLGLRDRAMLEVFYATGLRRAELARLECADANLGRGTLTVRQGKGGRDRVVPLGPRAAAWVQRASPRSSSPATANRSTPTCSRA